MANIESAKKRARQTVRRTIRNTAVRNQVKTAIRSAKETMTTSPGATAVTSLREAVSLIAKASNKGVLHPRAAARRISRLMKKFSSLSSAMAKTPEVKVAPAAKATKAKKPAAAPAKAKTTKAKPKASSRSSK